MRHRLVVTAGVAVVVASLAVSASQQPADNPSFEAASVKWNKSGNGRVGLLFQPGGINATNVTLQILIATAYGTSQPLPGFQMIGGPDWIRTDRFDVVAKAPDDTRPGPNGPMPLMIRALLKERFNLAVHNETRELPIYALVMARRDRRTGPQLKPAAVDCAAIGGPGRGRGGLVALPPQLDGPLPCGIRLTPGNMAGGGTSMTQFAFAISRYVNRVVVDRTGLAGNFDFDLQWTPEQMPPAAPAGPPGAPPLPAIDPNGPSIFTAVQEQLGLKLESTKGPVDVVVIDRAEHPTED